MAMAAGCALVLSFSERDGSDGLFIFPLLVGSLIILIGSCVATWRMRRVRPTGVHA